MFSNHGRTNPARIAAEMAAARNIEARAKVDAYIAARKAAATTTNPR